MTMRRLGLAFVLALAVAAPVSTGTAWAGTAWAGTASATGCTLASTNGSVDKFIGARSYRLHVPSGLTGPAVPLLVDLHGGGGSAQSYEYITGWSTYADQKKSFIVVYPNAFPYGFWNYGEGSADVAFISQVVDAVSAKYCIDPQRVFVDGHSNGGLMADRLACDAADEFAAFAPYAGSSSQADLQPTGMGGCSPSRSVPIAMFHGDSDSAAPIEYQRANRDWWVDQNNCATPPSHSTDTYGTLDVYAPCDGGAEIWWRVLTNQNHDWPTGAEGDDQRDRMWQFFNAHPLP